MFHIGCLGFNISVYLYKDYFSWPRWVKFPHSPILLWNKSVFPMAMYCFSHCFLYSRTECIMKYGAVRKFYPEMLLNVVYLALICKLMSIKRYSLRWSWCTVFKQLPMNSKFIDFKRTVSGNWNKTNEQPDNNEILEKQRIHAQGSL